MTTNLLRYNTQWANYLFFDQNFAVELQAESQLDLDLTLFTDALSRAGGANYGTGVRELWYQAVY